MENHIKSAVNIYVIKNNKILLGKRKKKGDGFWGLPGGHLEYGESPLEGALRELKEETGLIPNKIEYKNTVSLVLSDCHYVSINFVVKDIDDEPQLMEPEKFYEWKYFNLTSLPENIFIGHKKIIENLNSEEVLIN